MPKSLSPKKLNLDEMWELYTLLKKGIPEKEETYLVHEVIKIIQGISTDNFKKSLSVMYGDISKTNSGEFALMFVKGIKQNGLFSFIEFIKGLS